MKYRVRALAVLKSPRTFKKCLTSDLWSREGKGMGKIWGCWKENHSVAGEARPNSSKSPSCQFIPPATLLTVVLIQNNLLLCDETSL